MPASGPPSSEDLSTRSKLAAPAELSEAWAEELSFTGTRRQVGQKDSPLRGQISAAGEAHVCQEEMVDLFVGITRNVAVQKTIFSSVGILHSALFHNLSLDSMIGLGLDVFASLIGE